MLRTDAMRFRAAQIHRLGPSPGDAVRDPATIFAWAAEALDIPIGAALTLCRSCRRRMKEQGPPDDVALLDDLRLILALTQHLEVVRRLQEAGVECPGELEPWLAVLPERRCNSPNRGATAQS